ncbi:MAG: translation initiation factor IF-2 [Actinobacteria bacterium]|nr:translation initiation factor IF-2 [Actinomycetota bacterium]
MARPRVNEIARELGVSSKEVLRHLEEIGQPVKSHSSAVDEDVAARLRTDLGGVSAPEPEPQIPARTVAEPDSTPREAVSVEAEPQPEPHEVVAVEHVQDIPQKGAAPEPEATSAVAVHRGITVQDFAARVARSAAEVQRELIGLGEMVTLTQPMSDEAIELVSEALGIIVSVVDPAVEETLLEESGEDEAEDDGELEPRPPVVTVMGHVDHGKTSILDAIRRTNVVAGEAGGITQHIGAYQVRVNDRDVTFIDTPGHEAFTAMRARGAQVTDLAVLVVAADDGVMPQTVEAIDHARAARVPVVVAVNKIDRPDADPTRVRQQLSDHGLLPEEWGGETIYVDVSAKERTNLDTLLEMILLTSDVQLDMRANPHAPARGNVIEANLDKGRGPVATVLVKRGELRRGDIVLAGISWGKIRAMLDERGRNVKSAGPGTPVQVLGWQSLPEAGDEFRAADDEREARAVTSEREQHRRAADLVAQKQVSLQDLLRATQDGGIPELNLVLKADTQGSVEALDGQLSGMDQSLVKVNILRKGAGAITENDVALAQASGATVIGFNVVPTSQARALAEGEVDIRTYRVIYQAVQDIQDAARGLLGPETREVPMGQAEVRATFRVPRYGLVAGCMVIEGTIRRNARARLVRDGTVVYESRIGSLRRFKDDAREVAAGFECGIGIDGYQDVKEGDMIQAFEIQEVAR